MRTVLTGAEISGFPDTVVSQKRNIGWFLPYGFICATYILATLVTRPLFQGDTVDYASSIVAHLNGGYYQFWDFGHLLWRPLGWVEVQVARPLLARFAGPNPSLQATLALISVSWVAGLVSALILLALLRLYISDFWIPPIVVTAFVFSMAELNYSRTGSSYVPGLSFLILAIYLSVRAVRHPDRNTTVGLSILTGLALAGSISLWFLYSLAVPAAILLPLVLEGIDKTRLRVETWACISFLFTTTSMYVAVLIHLRLSTLTAIMHWVMESSHGTAVRGVYRMVFGWPRSFFDMGVTGKVIKRYLLHDPFNPVSLLDLLKLWPDFLKIGLFYATVLLFALSLRRSPHGKRALLIMAISAIPVLGFAIYWSGGDQERYLPLFPFFYLAFALSLGAAKMVNPVRTIGITFILSVVLMNAISTRPAAATQIQSRMEERITPLLPELKTGSRVFVSHNLDDLLGLGANFPFSSTNELQNLSLSPLVTLGRNDVPMWRVLFASSSLSAWQKDGDVWVSSRLLRATPQADWNWVEGDDPRVLWGDFNRFFSQLQYGKTVGGGDGFLQVLRSFKNEDFLVKILSKQPIQTRSLNTSDFEISRPPE